MGESLQVKLHIHLNLQSHLKWIEGEVWYGNLGMSSAFNPSMLVHTHLEQ